MSSMRVSSVGTPTSRSDMPVPRWLILNKREIEPKSRELSSPVRTFPVQLDVRDHLDRHEVARTVTDHLVGDVDIAALGVARVRLHRRSVAQFSGWLPTAGKKALTMWKSSTGRSRLSASTGSSGVSMYVSLHSKLA